MKEKIIGSVMAFFESKPMRSIKDGVLFVMPLTIIGAMFLLFAQLPVDSINKVIESIFGKDFRTPLFTAFAATFNIIAIVTTMGIAYIYTQRSGHEKLTFPASIIAFVTFLMFSPNTVTNADGVKIGGVIPMDWTGGKGMITAIIVGLLVGWSYNLLIDKKVTIKMPDVVPEGVAKQFTSLVPAAIIVFVDMLIYILFNSVAHSSVAEWIYKIIQTPMMNVTDSLPAIMLIAFAMSLLWFFGIHGTAVAYGVMGSIFLANTAANQQIITSGQNLTIANGAKIVTEQFFSNFITMSGTGITLGLLISIFITAKSIELKTLGKLAIVPGLFNINEPVAFGLPIVLNPLMAIPYMVVSPLAAFITYMSIRIGFMHPFSGVMAPWTTPPIISGFIVAGWQGAATQLVIITCSILIYLPFVKRLDKKTLITEQSEKSN
jgi:PTS system cellobiose-specific IIC component